MCKPDTPPPGALTQPFFISLHFFQMMSSEHLTCGWLQQLLVVLLKLCLTFAGPLRPLNGTECSAKSPASYILVFTGHWSPQAFPKQYPLFRPPAQWSKLLGEKGRQTSVIGSSFVSYGKSRLIICTQLGPSPLTTAISCQLGHLLYSHFSSLSKPIWIKTAR